MPILKRLLASATPVALSRNACACALQPARTQPRSPVRSRPVGIRAEVSRACWPAPPRPSVPSPGGPVAHRGVRIVVDLRHSHPHPGGRPAVPVDGAFLGIIGTVGRRLAAAGASASSTSARSRGARRQHPATAARSHLALSTPRRPWGSRSATSPGGLCDHVALDKTRWGQLALSAVAVAFHDRRHMAGRQADLPLRHVRSRGKLRSMTAKLPLRCAGWD